MKKLYRHLPLIAGAIMWVFALATPAFAATASRQTAATIPPPNLNTAQYVILEFQYPNGWAEVYQAVWAHLQDAAPINMAGEQVLFRISDPPEIAVEGFQTPYKASDQFYVVYTTASWWWVQVRDGKVYFAFLDLPTTIQAC